MMSRLSIAGVFFFIVTIGNLIQKFASNDYTKWFQNPIITMWFYSMAMCIVFYPYIARKGIASMAVLGFCLGVAGLVTYGFSVLYGT